MALFAEEDWEALRRIANFGGTYVLGRPAAQQLVTALEAAEAKVQAASETALGARVAELEAQLVKMDKALLDANPELKHLRDLIKEGVRAGENCDECPWCLFLHSEERNERARRLGFANGAAVHALDCPAFTGDGKVRLP